MPIVERTAIVPYTCAEMFALVNDFAKYPEFLPWCSLGQLQQDDENSLVATLGIKKGFISDTFTTRNVNFPPRTIHMELVDGPFEFMTGSWTFDPLGNQPIGSELGSRISLNLHFSFKLGIVNMLSSTLENDMTKMVSAFVTRAEDVYGERQID